VGHELRRLYFSYAYIIPIRSIHTQDFHGHDFLPSMIDFDVYVLFLYSVGTAFFFYLFVRLIGVVFGRK